MKTLPMALLGLALLVAPAMAQNLSAPLDDPEATLLEDLIVIAPTEGPAWWRVSSGESVVWIMALPESAAPKGMKWDRGPLERRIAGAHALLAPPTINLIFPAQQGAVESSLTPALAERFAKAQTRIRKPAKRYAGMPPAAAFLRLYRDYLDGARLSERGEALRWARAIAKTRKVPVVQPTTIQAGRLRSSQMNPDHPEAAACYEALVHATEVPAGRYRTVAAGWASGDLKVAASGPRNPFSICESRLFSGGAGRQAIDVQVAAIAAALERPGKAVALANLRALLADGGILDQLESRGYRIIAPTELGESD